MVRYILTIIVLAIALALDVGTLVGLFKLFKYWRKRKAIREAKWYLRFLTDDHWCTAKQVRKFMKGDFESEKRGSLPEVSEIERQYDLLVEIGLVDRMETQADEFEKAQGFSIVKQYKPKTKNDI